MAVFSFDCCAAGAEKFSNSKPPARRETTTRIKMPPIMKSVLWECGETGRIGAGGVEGVAAGVTEGISAMSKSVARQKSRPLSLANQKTLPSTMTPGSGRSKLPFRFEPKTRSALQTQVPLSNNLTRPASERSTNAKDRLRNLLSQTPSRPRDGPKTREGLIA